MQDSGRGCYSGKVLDSAVGLVYIGRIDDGRCRNIILCLSQEEVMFMDGTAGAEAARGWGGNIVDFVWSSTSGSLG